MTRPRHGISPRYDGDVPFSSTTHRVLDWLADQGLTPGYGGTWNNPPSMTVTFGNGSGWLWGRLDIFGTTGRLLHLKAFWTDAEGIERFTVAHGPRDIRAELERQATHRVERITQLAARHGLLALPTATPEALDTAVAALDSGQRTQLTSALAAATTTHNTATIFDTIEQVLQREAPSRTAIGVLFTTLNYYGTGHTLIEQGTALFDDGTTEDFDFIPLEKPFDEEYDRTGETFTLAVDLRTHTLDPQENFQGSIHRRFSVPPPPAPTRTVQQILCSTIASDPDTTDAELEALAAHVREHGPNDMLSVGIQTRFPQTYAAALQQPAPATPTRHDQKDAPTP